ncbi:nucleotide-binding domain containing protein, partial [Klebsiella pneumoniae]
AVAGKVYRIGSDIGLGSTVKIIHQLLAGVHIAVAAEAMALAAALKAKGFTRFIVAGGETSSIVAQTLGVEAFHIGPTISPG